MKLGYLSQLPFSLSLKFKRDMGGESIKILGIHILNLSNVVLTNVFVGK